MLSHRTLGMLILASALVFFGCGQKGALYLPDDDSARDASAALRYGEKTALSHVTV